MPPAVAQMKRVGLPFDADALAKLTEDMLRDKALYEKLFYAELDQELPSTDKLPRLLDGSVNTDKKKGFNVGSPKQLQAKLKAILGHPVTNEAGKESVAADVLKDYAADSPAIQNYLKWKKADKYAQMAAALSSHLSPKGRIHADYLQLGAHTGRFSCRNPNLQQVPRLKAFREAAIAPEGWSFVVADYSQLELRLLAAQTQDREMCGAFQRGEDLHSLTARALYHTADPSPEQRQIAKSANFGLAYGAGARGLRRYAGACGILMTLEEAAEIRDTWLGLYSGVAAWHRQCAEDARDSARQTIRIPGPGLERHLTPSSNRMTVHANTVIQGAGAGILKKALANLWLAHDPSFQICACVHDEIVLLSRDDVVPYISGLLTRIMVNAEAPYLGNHVPAVVDVGVGPTWGSAK